MGSEIPVDALLANWGLWARHDECRDLGTVWSPEDGLYAVADRAEFYGFPDETREPDERLAAAIEPVMLAMMRVRRPLYDAAWEYYVRESLAIAAAGKLRCHVPEYYRRVDAARRYVAMQAKGLTGLREYA